MNARAQQEKRDLMAARALIMLLTSLLMMPVGVVLRFDFGVRALSMTGFYMVTVMAAGTIIAGYVNGLLSLSPLFITLVVISFGAGVFQQVLIRRNRNQGKIIHSYDFGRSILYRLWEKLQDQHNVPVIMTEDTFQRLLEPLIVILVGAMLFFLDAITGIYLVIAGVAIAVRQAIHHQELMTAVLDSIDATLETEAMDQLIESYKNPAVRTQGTARHKLAEGQR